MFRKLSLLLLAAFLTVNSYSDNGIITVQERCQIAHKNLELLNNTNKQVFIREDGNLRALSYREILAQRAENEEIVHKFCNKTVEENIKNSAKYETRDAGEPSTITALRTAILSQDIDKILTALEIAALERVVEEKIKNSIEKEDFDAALSELDNIKNNTQDNKNITNTPWVFNTNSQSNSGSAGGRKASDSSKNEQHGDGGWALQKAEKDIAKLQEKLKQGGLSRAEKVEINYKIQRIKEKAQKNKKGENHNMRGK
ncbi:MAG: hypothetical protein J6M05_05840 [Cardiobacteriaceae bacterium]|nr:hypothetical protein [Cardiobacteriaceae bacterium]